MNDPARQTDRELYESVSSGDARALAELARRHAQGLYDFALRGTLDEQQAAAVLESAFSRVRNPVAPVPAQIDFRTWLYSLCLVEVLGLANETRTARIPTDDARFFQRTTNVGSEIAHWAWQAARGLRTRDYCALDLTLRRGVTPEEVAEAASLTRSNLYASIGRARGAFEESFAAMLLFEHGRNACTVLEEMVETAPGASLRPALRYQIVEHAEDCDDCRRTLDSLPLAANAYISLADVDVPEALARRILGEPSEPVAEARPDLLAASWAEAAAAQTEETAQAPAAGANPEQGAGMASLGAETVLHGANGDFWQESVEAPPGTGVPGDPAATEAASGEFVREDEEEAPEAAQEQEEELDHETELASAPAQLAGATLLVRREPAPAPLSQRHRDDTAYEGRTSLRERIALWVGGARGQPLMLSYALMGVAAVVAIYLGIAVADSLQNGGDDSGAMPLDAPPGASAEREIDCGDTPVEMEDDGAPVLVSFDENALDGYQIRTLSLTPTSDEAEFEDVEATLEDPFSILFSAKEQETTQPRTEEFELRIQWVRGEESASSTCQLLVDVTP